MTLRPAAPEDAEAVTAIWNRIITETSVTFTTTPKTAAEVAVLITARAPAFIVAEGQGQVLGFASYAPFRSGPGYAHTMEHTILIAPQGQDRGLGRALMQALETTAREAGVHCLIGAVSGENAGGLAFHHALGFSEAGRLPQVGHKFGRWMDLVLMHKLL
jgi:phosphinothricin acetyltransferase